jgi:transcriptional regulator with XRE-family HTH domain
MQTNDFAENLRLLCGYYASVAEVCRRVEINRQQFNKYLGGTTEPSMHTLRRICDFFGVDETEIYLPSQEFAELVNLRRVAPPAGSPLITMIEQIGARHPDSQHKLRRYCGYYACYQNTPAYPGMIIKYLAVIYQKGDHTYAKAIERLVEKRRPELGTFICKYLSVVLHTDDRIYVMDHNPLSHQVLAMTVLYPSHRTRLHLLSGLCLAVSGGPGRQAFATRIVYEYLGETTDKRQAIGACGLYPEDSDEIGPDIRSRVRNAIGPQENTLCAVEF